MCRQNFAIAISAPVLPAETAQSASPFFTASIASHIDDAAPAGAQGLARLVGHLDRRRRYGGRDFCARAQARAPRELRRDRLGIAET